MTSFFFHHQPVLKSQEPSPEDSKGPVMVLKGKTFSQIVSEGGKGWTMGGVLVPIRAAA